MVDAHETDFKSLINGTLQYVVPLYQRPYQWKKKEWETLWHDLEELTVEARENATASHFIGSIVLVPQANSAGPAEIDQYLVIDGQQRLTTLLLILTGLRGAFKHTSPPDAERIQEQYLTNPWEDGDLRLRLLPTQVDRDTLSAIIFQTPIPAEPNNIVKAFNFFSKKIRNGVDVHGEHFLKDLEESIVGRLTLVSITTDEKDNIHRIFQSLNNTGQKLTQGDLIRNDIFMRIPEESQVAYERFWLPIQKSLDNKSIEQLFWLDSLRSYPTLRLDETFPAVRKHLDAVSENSKDSATAVTTELERYFKLSQRYRRILNPELEEDRKVRSRLERLQQWDSNTPHSLVLVLLTKRDEGEATSSDLEQALFYLESYLVRRLVGGRISQGLNRTFPSLISSIEESESIAEDLRRQLSTGRRYYFSDAELRHSIPQLDFYHLGTKVQRRVILEWIEDEFDSKEPVSTENLTIEHVMPQTLSQEWRDTLGAKYPDVEISDAHIDTVHTLGNLTLTGYNRELSNAPFAQKKLLFDKSGIQLSKAITQKDDWGFDEIYERSNQLCEKIIETWAGPLPLADRAEQDTAEVNQLRWDRALLILDQIPDGDFTSITELAKATGITPRELLTRLGEQSQLFEYPLVDFKEVRGDEAQQSLFQTLEEPVASALRDREETPLKNDHFLDAGALSDLLDDPS